MADPLLSSQIDDYLSDLATIGHRDAVLDEMETRARERRFPIIGRAVGRHLELQARTIGARRVFELGSGYGYSAYWFGRAVGPDGEVVCTDADPDNARIAEDYLRRAGTWDRTRYHVGDALDGLAREEGEADIVFCDIDKDLYPAAWEAARERIRVGGLFICDNVLWRGRVAEREQDDTTRAVSGMTRAVAEDERYLSSIVPLRDGVLVALRVS